LSFIERCNYELIILPGIDQNTPSINEIKSVINKGTNLFIESGDGCSSGEGKTTPTIVTKDTINEMPKQIFVRKPKAKNIDELIAIWDERTIKIGQRKFTFILCGEIIGFNPDSKLKYKRSKPAHDIIINPCHKPMGHWNYLGEKLKNLSLNSASLYVANNTFNHNNVKTDLRIYHNGIDVTKRINEKFLTWSKLKILN
jgi:hypothetical protein